MSATAGIGPLRPPAGIPAAAPPRTADPGFDALVAGMLSADRSPAPDARDTKRASSSRHGEKAAVPAPGPQDAAAEDDQPAEDQVTEADPAALPGAAAWTAAQAPHTPPPADADVPSTDLSVGRPTEAAAVTATAVTTAQAAAAAVAVTAPDVDLDGAPGAATAPTVPGTTSPVPAATGQAAVSGATTTQAGTAGEATTEPSSSAGPAATDHAGTAGAAATTGPAAIASATALTGPAATAATARQVPDAPGAAADAGSPTGTAAVPAGATITTQPTADVRDAPRHAAGSASEAVIAATTSAPADSPVPGDSVAAAPTEAAPQPAAQAGPTAAAAAPAPAPTASAATVTPATPVPAAAHVPSAVVHPQLVRALPALLRLGQGTHSIDLELHPAELGAVQLRVELTGRQVSLSVTSADPAVRDLLRDTLPELRRELERSGLSTGDFDVPDRRSRDEPEASRRTPAGRAGHGTVPIGIALPSPLRHDPTRALDVRV